MFGLPPNGQGHKETFTVTVTPAPDIPLDVYILMDFSASTRDDLQVLQQIAHQIGQSICMQWTLVVVDMRAHAHMR